MQKTTEQQVIDMASQPFQPRFALIDEAIAKYKIPPETVFFFDENLKKIGQGSTRQEWIHKDRSSRDQKQSIIPDGTTAIVSNGSIKMDMVAGSVKRIITNVDAPTPSILSHEPITLTVKGNVEAGDARYGSLVLASGDIRINKNGDNLFSGGNISVGEELRGKNEAKGAIKAGSINRNATIATPILYLKEGSHVSDLKAKVGFIPDKQWDNFSPTRELPAFATVKEVTPLSRLESGKLSLSSTCKSIGGTMKEITPGDGGFDAGLVCAPSKNTGVRQK